MALHLDLQLIALVEVTRRGLLEVHHGGAIEEVLLRLLRPCGICGAHFLLPVILQASIF